MMVCSLGIAAYGEETDTTAETGSITIDNPQASETYTAYQIFEVEYNTDKSAYSYTIKNDSAWFETVAKYALPENSNYTANQPTYTGANGLTLTQSASDPTVYVVTTTDAFSAPAFAAYLKGKVTGKTGGQALTTAGNVVKATGLDLGYYFVTSTTGALCNLTTTNPNATIHDKNDRPFDKQDDQDSVDVGQTVNYTITGKVPDTTGFDSYTYLITDTMTEGLTFKKDVKVTIGGSEVTTTEVTDKDAALTGNQIRYSDKGFELSIDVMKNNESIVTKEIKVEYSATVNENAVAKIEKNKAILTYSNDPTTNTTKDTEPDEETVYSAKIVIDKYAKNKDNESDQSTKLAGAKFVLYKEVTTGEGDSATTTKQYYKWDATNKKVEWDENISNATVKITDDKGAASFDGIADGTYYLLETEAPKGYNLLTAPVEVKVEAEKDATTKEIKADSLTVTKGVENNTGALLPSTGGIGTTLFYILGSALVVGAAVLLIVRRRMRAEK